MTGGKSRPKKDYGLKVSSGQRVKAGQLLGRGISAYKAGENVEGKGNLVSLCEGLIYFTHRKVSRGKFRTFVNIKPALQSPKD